jgi:hypothetical protein
MAKLFKVGEFYRRLKDEKNGANDGIVLTSPDNVFECHAVDDEGNCWSMHSTYDGAPAYNDGEGWCVAIPKDLERGSVVLVETVPYPH